MNKDFEVRIAVLGDLNPIAHADWLLKPNRLREKIERREIIVCDDDGQITGLLRYSWFWEIIPFIDFLWVEEGFRGERRASRMIARLEEETEGRNHWMIMTSTQSNEAGQGFFRKAGFADAGGFSMRSRPFELLLIKYLEEKRQGP